MNNMKREHVDGELLARLTSALEDDEKILEAYLFGSHARGQALPHSDVDVYVDEEHVAGRRRREPGAVTGFRTARDR